MYCDFLGRAGGVFNQICKWRSMSGGLKIPLTSVSVGNKYGAQHPGLVEHLSHIPGLKVVFPATYDAKGMMYSALWNGRLSSLKPEALRHCRRIYPRCIQRHVQVPFANDHSQTGKDLTI
jgi:pyruvate/2-oxoglutarate/acetoin dehydrogenase E1 component